MRWPVPLFLTLPALFAVAWTASRVAAYYFWTIDEVVADFAAMALPSHLGDSTVQNIAAGFREAVIAPLVSVVLNSFIDSARACGALNVCGHRLHSLPSPQKSNHLLSIRAHVACGALATVGFLHNLVFNFGARSRHRAVAPLANLGAFGLAANTLYVMLLRPEGMVPVGRAAAWTNVIAVICLLGGVIVGIASVKSATPDYVLHRRAMIVASGGLFMNAAQRFALAITARIPALTPVGINTWPLYRDSTWELGIVAGTIVCFAVAFAYAWGYMGTGAAETAKMQAKVAAASQRKTE